MHYGKCPLIARRVMATCLLSLGALLWAGPGAAQSATETEIQFQTSTYAGEEGTILSIEVTRVVTSSGDFTDPASAQIVVGAFETANDNDISAPSFPLTLDWGFDDLGTRTISIELIDDGAVEGDEIFVLRIADVSGSDVGIGTPTVTRITINDPPSGPNTLVQFQGNAYRDVEGNVVQVMLERVRAPNGTLPVDAAQAIVSVRPGGSASVPDDTGFTNPTRINWAAGDTAPKTLPIRLTDDFITEGTENFLLEIDDVTGDAGLGTPLVATVTIEDANPGELRFVGEPYRVQEGNSIQIQVERFGGSDGAVSISMGDEDITAEEGVDFEGVAPFQGSWRDGETGIRTFTYITFPDADTEGDETFEVLDLDGFRAVGPGIAVVTIIDNVPATPGTLQFTSSTYSANEASGSLALSVERINGTDGAATVQYTILPGTAQQGSDFTGPLTGQLSWNDGNADSQSIEISLIDDTVNEPLENLQVELTSSTGAVLGTPILATAEITDDDPLVPGVVDFDMSVYSVGEADGSVTLSVLRTGGSDGAVSVDVQLSDVTASFPDDGAFAGDEDFVTLNWLDGDSSPQTVRLFVNTDTDISEGQERFDVSLSGQSGGLAIGTSNPTASVFIDDGPAPGTPGEFSISPTLAVVDEAGSSVSLTVTRNFGSLGAVSVDYSVLPDTGVNVATPGVDFGTTPPPMGTLNWADGDAMSRTVTVDIVNDSESELDEVFTLVLSNASGGAFVDTGGDRAVVTITDDDPLVSPGVLSFITDYTVSESSLTVRIEATRTGGADGRVTAQYALGESGDSAELNADYADMVSAIGTLLWEDGDGTSKFIDVDIVLDSLIEDDEIFTATILDTTGGAGIGTEMSIVTITDTPPPVDDVRFEMVSVIVQETVSTFDIVVQRVGTGSGNIEVFYDLVSGTATLGTDFNGPSNASGGSLFWRDGDLTDKTIPITVVPDTDSEGVENFTVELSIGSSSGNVNLGSPNETVIAITDLPPTVRGTVQFDPVAYTVSELDGSVDLTITRTGGSDGAISVGYEVLGGTATLGTDHSVTEPQTGRLLWPDRDNAARTITVDIASDSILEADEVFSVALIQFTDSGSFILDTAMVTIVDRTVPDSITLVDAAVEVAETTGVLSLTVQRTGAGLDAVSVLYSLVDGTAEAGIDYANTLPTTGTVSWAAGDVADKTIEIDIASDVVLEPDETFLVNLALNPASQTVTLGSPAQTTVTITDVAPPAPGVLQFDPDEYTVAEADGSVELQVTRTSGSDGPASAEFEVVAASAIPGSDIALTEPVTGVLNWPAGDDTPRTITVDLATDDEVEGEESFNVLLSGITGAVPGAATTALVNLMDSTVPTPDTVVMVDASVTADENSGSLAVTVQRVGSGVDAVSVAYSVSDATATGGLDFDAGNPPSGIVSWAAGDTTDKIINIDLIDDALVEPDETFSVTLSPDAASVLVLIGTPDSTIVTIEDTTPPPVPPEPGTIQFITDSFTVDEDAGAVTLEVTRTNGNDGRLTVVASTVPGSAGTDDFSTSQTALVWPDGDDGTRQLIVPIVFDSVTDPSESFAVVLSNATPDDGVLGTPTTATVLINDVFNGNPGTVQFASEALSADENDGSVTVVVTRTGGNDSAVSVNYSTNAGSATSSDFEANSGTLTWADGDGAPKSFAVAIVADAVSESDELFTAVLSDALPLGVASIGSPDTVEITILDDSVAPPGVLAFTATTASVAEADGTVELQVSRTDGSNGAVSVGYTTVVRSADETDFQPVSGRLNWDNGDMGVRTIRVPVNRDGLVEPDEQFQVVLAQSEPFGDTQQLGSAVATVSITDSTRLGNLSFVTTELSVTERENSVTLSVSRSGGSDGDVSVDYELIGGSAVLGLDVVDQSGTLNWADLDAEPKSIRVLINTDNLVEGSEQFIVALSNAQPLGAQQIDRAQATVTIIDTTVLDDTSTPPLNSLGELDLVVVSGDGQSGLPGDLLEPLVIDVIDRGASDATVANVPILWRAVPEGSAELLEGGRSSSDDDGRTNNRIRILTRGFLRVVATIDVAPPPTSALAARNNPQPFPVGQGEAVFTVRSGIGPAEGLRSNQVAIGTALDVVCEVLGVRIEQQQAITAEQQDLFETCQEVEARLVSDDGLGTALDRLIPEELFFLGDSIIDTTDIQVTNVYSRINAIRSGQVDAFDLSGLQLNHYDQSIPGSVVEAAQDELSGGAASADGSLAEMTRLGFFATGSISYGEVDGGENQSDAEFRSSGLTLGADYRATDYTVYGMGIGIVNNDTDFNPDAGSAQVTGLNLTLFGTYYQPNKGYIDAVLDFGRNNYDIERRINLPNTPDQFGVGDTTANVRSLTIGAGRDYRHKSWEFGPYGRLSLIDADINGYSERAAGSADGFGSVLNISSHSIQSSRFALGGQVSRTVSTNRGVFIPQFRVEAEFENENRKEGIEATFQHDPTQTPFIVNGEDRDSSYFNLGIGTSALFRNGRSGFMFYETQQGNDRVTQHWLKLGIRLEF